MSQQVEPLFHWFSFALCVLVKTLVETVSRFTLELVLVRLEFELKLEPLLLYSPAAAAAAAPPTPALC